MFFVYCIRNKVNDKLYIGWSNNYEKRWKQHIKAAFSVTHKDYKNILYRSFRKYTKEKSKVKDFFEFQVLEEFNDKKKSLEAEMFWIKFFKTNICKYGDKYGYNMTDGGDTSIGFRHSEETKEKLRQERLGKYDGEKNPFFGQKHTDETKQRMKDSWTEAKLSGTRKPHNLGKKISEEQRLQMSIVRVGKFIGEKNPNVKLNWEKVGKIREEYKTGNFTCQELGNKYNVSKVMISDIIRNKNWKINE
jgi:group I intron endonuclease